ncbi:Methyl-cpg-binding domain-containing protein 7 [Melia azedarach]|uniref:Methyl-cpg-binding domain-containing protein 7 n=1 Tax=Melia azedarach TaxID=155640 RepID=A0ACC1YRR8_MELAZ|nr:Methyl-cpg-binding domain-containing protein 7 [Melia azedarach]
MKKKKKISSPSTRPPRPLQILGPREKEQSSRELQILVSASPVFSSSFKLPRGWSVEERPRINSPCHPDRVDKYYYEPGTGRKFRSLIAIQKYLSGEEGAVAPKRVKSGNGGNMQIVPSTTKNASLFGLPDHWIVQEIPRKNINYAGTVDRYYIEPGTGLRFRSRIAAERYLEEVRKSKSTTNAREDNQSTKTNISDEDLPLRIIVKQQKEAKKIKVTSKSLKPGKHYVLADNSVSCQNYVSGKEVTASTLNYGSLPAKVKWVLGSPGGNVWNPFVGESMVPESVKQEWSEIFFLSIHEK